MPSFGLKKKKNAIYVSVIYPIVYNYKVIDKI